MPAGTPELWARVVADVELVGAAAGVDPGSVSAVQKLRKQWGADEVSIALDLAAARRKLERKWPGEELVGDVAGTEMASSARAARWKASRFDGLGLPIVDLCSGIGCDARALADVGDTIAIELDPVRAWMTGQNSGADARCGDIAGERAAGGVVHIDPARRSEKGRAWRYEELVPAPHVFEPICESAAGAAVKLGPGVEPGVLPEGELVFISEAEPRGTEIVARRLTQAVLFTGALRRPEPSRAVLLGPDGLVHECAGERRGPGSGPMPDAGQWIFTIDPAIERAGLIATVAEDGGLGCPHPRAGLLAGDEPIESPWLTGFRLVERMPWSPRRVSARLAELGAGVVEVKVRGVQEDPDRLQRVLRGPGDDTYTVFVYRFGDAIEALLARRGGLQEPANGGIR